MAQFSPLPSRKCMVLSGADAKAFLQSLISVDVLKLNVGDIRYGLLLSPQGKFLHDMFIIGTDDGLLLDTDEQQAATLLKRLTLYKLKRDVSLTLADDWHVGVIFGEPLAPTATTANQMFLADPRLPALGLRIYSKSPIDAEAFSASPATPEDYLKHRVALTIPDGGDMIADKTFAFDFDMDDLHAVDYSKGCYVGQEVTARMHYRGTPKKGVYHVVSTDGQNLPNTTTDITHNEKVCGFLSSSAGNQAIAMIRHEFATAGSLLADNIKVTTTRPTWAKTISTTNEEQG